MIYLVSARFPVSIAINLILLGALEDTDAQGQSYWSDLEELARPARERRRLPPATRSEIIIRLCSMAPLSVKELSLLLDRSEAYVGDAIRPLVTAGDLTFLYPDQPRHPRQKYISAAAVNGTAAPPRGVPDTHEKFAPPRKPAAVPVEAPVSAPREAKPVERPRPTAITPMQRATAPPPQPIDATITRDVTDNEGVTTKAPRYPNQWTNVAYVIVAGLVLGLTAQKNWVLFAAIASAALSWLHTTVDSAQYRRFRTLQSARSRMGAFMLLKSAVTFIEIAIIYIATLAYNGRL